MMRFMIIQEAQIFNVINFFFSFTTVQIKWPGGEAG